MRAVENTPLSEAERGVLFLPLLAGEGRGEVVSVRTLTLSSEGFQPIAPPGCPPLNSVLAKARTSREDEVKAFSL
jgi:hypothetical protein